jgi:hypothetical protein
MQIMRPLGNKLSQLRTLFAAAALTAAALLLAPAPQAHAAVFLSVGIAPPAIPVYAQPLCPGDGYLWTPGYWAWGPDGYYWVDGAWVEPPYAEALWTPGWWGFYGGAYLWYPGYWGRTVGYYGGVNYGFGYFGTGFYGGYWRGGHFFYNRAYGHFGPGFRGAVYNRTYAGFSGRPGGASFNSHPPAQYARGDNFRSTVHGAEFHGNAAAGNRSSESFHGNQGFRGNEGSASRGNEGFHGNEGSAGRGNFGGAQPSYNRQAPASNSGARNFNQAPRGNVNSGAVPHYSAPSGGGSRGGSAPAPHYSAPSGGGSHGGGGAAHGDGHR